MAPRRGREFTTADFNAVHGPINTLMFMFDNSGPFEGALEQNLVLASQMSNFKASPNSQELTSAGTQAIRNEARSIADRIDTYQKEEHHDLDATPAAAAYRNELLRATRNDMRNMQKGISLVQDKEFISMGHYGLHGLIPNMSADCFKPGNVEVTEAALKNYPLDKYLKVCNDLQENTVDFELNKGKRTPEENAKQWSTMQQQKAELQSLSTDLYMKSQNPTKEVISLFGKETDLTGPNGFRGNRGLEHVLETLEKDLSRTASPAELQSLDDSLKTFNTERSSFFRRESAEHKTMREAVEKVQNNMKKLNEGNLSPEERTKLNKETYMALRDMDEKTEKYINHASPNGRQPATEAGKIRLAGAKELKDFSANMKARFETIPEIKDELYRESEAKFMESLPKGSRQVFERMNRNFQGFEDLGDGLNATTNPNAQAYGLNDFQYMAAEMVATATVKEGIKNGSIQPQDAENQIRKAIPNVAKDSAFKDWANKVCDSPSYQSRVGRMTPEEVMQDLQDSVEKDMARNNEANKEAAPEKETRTADKQSLNNSKNMTRTPQERVRQNDQPTL